MKPRLKVVEALKSEAEGVKTCKTASKILGRQQLGLPINTFICWVAMAMVSPATVLATRRCNGGGHGIESGARREAARRYVVP